MSESKSAVDRSEVNAVIYSCFKMIAEDRKVYPDQFGKRVPGIPLPLTVLVYEDKKQIRDMFPTNSDFGNYIISETSFYEGSKTKDFKDNNKALKVYNAMGFTYPPSMGGRSFAQYFKDLKENDMKKSGNATKENINRVIGSTSFKEAFY